MPGADERGSGRRFDGGALAEAGAERDALRAPRGERDRLEALNSFRVLDTKPEPEFDAIAALAAQLADTPAAAITFVDDRREWVKAAAGLDLPEVRRVDSFGGRVVGRWGPVVMEDARCDPLASGSPWVVDEPGVRFYAAVPLTAGGLVVGTLAVLDTEPRAASADLLERLLEAAAVLMPHLERRREDALAHNLTVTFGFDGRFERVSAAFESVLGWKPEEIVGRHILEFVHQDDVERTRARIERLKNGRGSAAGFECRYRCRDGGHRWLLWSSRVIPHEERIYSAGRDITDRKRQELALRESEARYRLLAENATDMIAGHDLEGINTYVSSAGRTLTGFTADELIGRSAYELIHPGDAARLRVAHERLLEAGQPVRVVIRLRRKDETWIWVETIARLVRDHQSRPVGIQSSSRDITETKQAVEALEAAREHFRKAFDDAPIGMCILDAKAKKFERANAALCELLGHDEDDFLSSNNPVELIHPDDRGGESDGVRGLLKGERRTFAFEKRLLRKDGKPVWARVTTSVMRDGPGPDARMLAHVEDIDVRRRNAEDLLRAREEAERANRAKSEFLSRMSHELRTPLNAVLGFAQLIDDEDISPSQRESVSRILRGGYHLLNLVNDVLDISAIESGLLPIECESVSTTAVVNETIEMMRPLADARSIRIHCDLPDIDVAVDANGQRLKQVLLNLVSNAIKYSPPNAEVTVGVASTGDMRGLVRVIDTGPGIPADQLERVFVPFERLGARREVEGTGLGLPLSRNLVQAMGGTLAAESGTGGSTFTVDLPLAVGGARERQPAAYSGGEARSGNGNGRLRRVLYIEDNASNVELLARLVDRRDDLELHAAGRGDAGIELARRLPPDVVLLDLHLPDTTGDVVLRQLRADESTRDVPVIVITADVTQDHEKRLLAAGATDYMTKPLELDRLTASLDRALARGNGRSG